jgi:hypothetical protein
MARTNTSTGGGGGGVESLNALTGAVTLSAGNNITLNESGNDIEITANFTQEGKYMISGGITWSGTGLTYDVSFLNYFFNGNKTANPTQVTLAASDPTNNRFDAIVVDEAGTVTAITGTASANPEVPAIPEDQLQVTIILVAAGSTTPTIASEEIYMDDPTTNWTFSTYTTGAATGSINFAGTNSPKQGVNDIEASTDPRLGARFVRSTSFDAFQYTMLQVWVRFTGTAVASNKALNVRFENSAGSLVGSTVNLFSYGLSRSILNTWQLVVVPITAFGALPATVKGMKMIMAGGTVGVVRQWDIDYMILTNGSVPFANVPTIAFYKDDVGIASQSGINIKQGTGVTIDAVNNPLYNRVDYTINSSGGGGGIAIGDTVTGSGKNRILFIDGGTELIDDADFTRDVGGQTLFTSTFGTDIVSYEMNSDIFSLGTAGIGTKIQNASGDYGLSSLINAGGTIRDYKNLLYSTGERSTSSLYKNRFSTTVTVGVDTGEIDLQKNQFSLKNDASGVVNGIENVLGSVTMGNLGGGNGTKILINDTNQSITFSGGETHSVKTISDTDSPYSVTKGDYYIDVDTTTNGVEILLPSVSTVGGDGKTYIISDYKKNAGTNTIIVYPDGTETINQTNGYMIATDGGSITIHNVGTNWVITSKIV